jgi:glutamine cyclotransferase
MGKKSSSTSIRTTTKRRGGVFKTTFAVLSLVAATFLLLLAFRRERSSVSSLSSLKEEKEDDHVTNQFLREAFEEEKEISSDIEYHTYSIVNSYPHDTNAFTQGFLFHSASETFFESTGSVPHGKLSDVRRADIETGEVLELKTIPESAFGEGLVFMREETKRAKKNSLVQLVWKSSRAFTHEIKDIGGEVEEKNNALLFEEESGEQNMFNTDLRDGWGVTSSEREGVIVISNGTAHLTLFDMNKGQSVGFITVHDNGVEQRFPNELEAVRGEIWANILEKECVARINERTGKVLGWIDFTGLKKLQDNVGSVMNGIAYDERRDRIFVTGKQWRRVFEVKISKGSRKKGAIELGRKRCHSPTSLPNYGYP